MATSLSAAPSRRGWLLIALVAGLALVGGSLWYVHASQVGNSAEHVANDGSEIGVMMGLADAAYREQRLVAPVGSNVYEFYFSVLQLDPNNAVAQQRLRDALKPASDAVEGTINAGNLDEAQRELALLRMYDAQNYKLDLLGSVLDAQRVIERRRHEAEAARIQAQQMGDH